MRRKNPHREIYVVYVTFPTSNKEYCYLCDIPGLRQGDRVIANGTEVEIRRTASYDPRAVRYVGKAPSAAEKIAAERKKEIARRLQEIEREVTQAERWKALASKSPEARTLLAELKRML